MIVKDRPYFRKEIDLAFVKRKAIMHAEALKRGGDGVALYQDCYTGKLLRGGDPYDYEHIRSSEEIFMKYRHILTNEQIAEVVNCRENVGVTLRTINQSKGKRRLEDWLSSGLNRAELGVDLKHAMGSLRKADEGIMRIVKEIAVQLIF
ncbi:hypothetical protein SAMN05444372_10635 [Flavobacterium micromati]|uniref:Uncharacterized protein n=1 Tax=Flavobacterium micromati TaxID=229205 RepID=A0A1M5JW13_9FLAO|nr:hypothetical protein [Flavobacterium micromati]SHG44782.1 hypothetical protein SAMN05444372_10635 [Flavobacterium micromati]